MKQTSLTELCNVLEKAGFAARLDGEDRQVSAVNSLEDAVEGEISFLSSPKHSAALEKTRASAVLVADRVPVPDRISAIRCEDPYATVTAVVVALHGHREHPQWGISERANIHESALIGDSANIGPGATIAADVTIGNNCAIYPGCYVADRVRIGDDCILYPNVVIYDGCTLGDRVTIHSGSVIGEDGLGYAPHNGKWLKIPQVGHAVLGNDVEIGANCAIDRATLGRTLIEDGTKFGNCVVIGHGTKIGPDCLFVGQVGVAGSVTVGRHVTLAGQVGVVGHLSIGDNTRIAGQSAVVTNVDPDSDLLGSPAVPIGKARRAILTYIDLPDWVNRIKKLEREIEKLRGKIDSEG